MVFRKHFSLICISFLLVLPIAKSSADIIALAFAGEPWSVTANGSEGVIPLFYKQLATQSGLKIEIQVVPYQRMLVMLDKGDGDIAIFFKSAASQEVAIPLAKLTTLNTIIFPRSGVKINRYADLYGLKIGVKRGVANQPRFDADPMLNKVQINSYFQAVQMLLASRIDALTGSESSIYYNLGKVGYQQSSTDKPFTLFTREVWLQVSRNSTLPMKTIKQLTRAAEALSEDNLYQEILDNLIRETIVEYQGPSSEQEEFENQSGERDAVLRFDALALQ